LVEWAVSRSHQINEARRWRGLGIATGSGRIPQQYGQTDLAVGASITYDPDRHETEGMAVRSLSRPSDHRVISFLGQREYPVHEVNMKVLVKSAWGSDDPTKAAFPFLHANALAEAGHDAQIFLLGEAVSLMRDPVAHAVVPVGWPPLAESLRATVGLGIPIHV
jgi:hypothetical protein